MKNCVNCDFELEDNAKFCLECGEKQPVNETKQNTGSYQATIGDKNVISGNIIGKNEEFKISGNAIINKTEQSDKERIISCAVSGKRIPLGDSIHCLSCEKDVAPDYFSQKSNRCSNCDKNAFDIYRLEVGKVLNDSLIDATEQHHLNRLASTLLIEETKREELQKEVRIIQSKKAAESISLSRFHQIEFDEAIKQIFGQNNIEAGFVQLKKIFTKNSTNDEVANLYYLIEAIHSPQVYRQQYETRSIDIFWQHYWAFLPYLINGDESEAYDVIENNKILFADKTNDILIAEVAFYIYSFLKKNKEEYLQEAKLRYVDYGKSVKAPLITFVNAIDIFLSSEKSEYRSIFEKSENEEKFIFKYVLGLQQDVSKTTGIEKKEIERKNLLKTTGPQNTPAEIVTAITAERVLDSKDEVWVDEKLGLKIKHNKLFFIDPRDGKEYPTFITESTIWLARNLAFQGGDFCMDESNPNATCVYGNVKEKRELIIPKGWLLPTSADWNYLSSFVANKTQNEHWLKKIRISGIDAYPYSILECINSNSSKQITLGEEYELIGSDQSGSIFVFDISNDRLITQPNSDTAIPFGADQFKVLKNWTPGSYNPPGKIFGNFGYIHPKYPLVKYFGINYNYASFFIEGGRNNCLQIAKNKDPYLDIIDSNLSIRCFVQISEKISKALKDFAFALPDYLSSDEITSIYTFPNGETDSSKRENQIKLGEKLFCSKSFKVDYAGEYKQLHEGNFYNVDGIKPKNGLVAFSELSQPNKASQKLWLPLENFKRLIELPGVVLDDDLVGRRIVCVVQNEFDQGNNEYLKPGELYLVTQLKAAKALITLAEFPQQNKADKFKWFHSSNFRMLPRTIDSIETDNIANNKLVQKDIAAPSANISERVETRKISQIEPSQKADHQIEIANSEKIKVSENTKTGKVQDPKKEFISVKIGQQEWLTQNLNINYFRNGDILPEAKSLVEWQKYIDAKKPAWSYFNNSLKEIERYGKIYNWYAVSDQRNLAPEGWHIPSLDEWEHLIKSSEENKRVFEVMNAMPNGCILSHVGLIFYGDGGEDTFHAWSSSSADLGKAWTFVHHDYATETVKHKCDQGFVIRLIKGNDIVNEPFDF